MSLVLGVRGISRVTDIAHTTILNWIEQSGAMLPDAYDPFQRPQVGELDELETNARKKQNKVWIWTVVDHFAPGILGWVVGDHSAATPSTLVGRRALGLAVLLLGQ